MARVGRKRKVTIRHPDGTPKRVESVSSIKHVANLQRMRAQMQRQITHPMMGYGLGRAFLLEQISEIEHLAGCRWAWLTGQYLIANGLKPPHSQAASFQTARGKALENLEAEKKGVKVTHTYNEARRALQANPGQLREVDEVCMYDDYETEDSQLLAKGLRTLVLHWGLTV